MRILLLTCSLLLASMSILSAQKTTSPAFASSSNSNHRQAQNKFEGASPMPFQAFDMSGKTHFLPEYKGSVIVMAFWAAGDEGSREQIKSLNQLKREFSSQNVAIISFADEDKADLVSFLKNNQIEYPVIPNSKTLGAAGYGDEFGTSRIFIIDKNGVVQKVIITDSEKDMDTYNTLQPIVKKLLK